MGSSFGAAVAVYTGGVDDRVAAVISSGGWGNGERKFRGQHPGEEAWKKFTDMLERGKKHREETGEPLFVDRYEIVPIPEHLRVNMPSGSVQQFTADTAQGMMEFTAEDVIAHIAPRPFCCCTVLWIRSRRPNNRSKCLSGPDSRSTCI